MRRHLPTAALTLALVPPLVGLPTVSRPAAKPRPVAPHVRAIPLHAAPGAAVRRLFGTARPKAATRVPAPAQGGPEVLTGEQPTDRFDLVAVSWDRRDTQPGTTVQVRVRESGRWSGWQELEEDGDGPDLGTAEAAASRTSTAPLVTDGADGVQVRVDTATGVAPAGLDLQLVDGGASAADAPVGPPDTAVAATGRPAVVTRAQWGADERLVRGEPTVNSTVRALVVHHTDTVNGYSPAQAYAQVRAVYAFHTKVRGWNDVGYNFLVDRYGRVYEGRRGSITRAIQGAHAGGFNSQTLGISVLGSFSDAAPPAAAQRAVQGVVAWKAAQYFLNPAGSTVLTSAGGYGHRAGERVRARVVSGHRDVGPTECPGNAFYPRLPTVRSSAAARLVPGLVAPTLSASSATAGGSPLAVTAAVPTTQRWTLTVTPICRTAPVRTVSGTATSRIAATWNLRNGAGVPVAPGIYRLSLATRSPVGAVPVWHREVEVLPPLPGPAAPPAGACAVQRVSGVRSAATAVVLGRRTAPAATGVVLVRGFDLADAAVAAPLARAKGVPLLYTATTRLPAGLVTELRRRKVTKAWVVGSAASGAVLAELARLGVTATRLAGRDRFATAAAVAAEVGGSGAVLLSGEAADLTTGASGVRAAAVAGAAAAARRPVLWVTRRGVPQATLQALASLRITRVTLAAPPERASQAVVTVLGRRGVGVRRVAVADPAGAAAAALAELKVTPAAGVIVASSDPRALPDVVAAGATGRALVLTGRTAVPRATAAYLAAHRTGTTLVVGSLQVLGTRALRALTAVAR